MRSRGFQRCPTAMAIRVHSTTGSGPLTAWRGSSTHTVSATRHWIQQGEVTMLGRDIRSIQHRDAVCPRIAYMP